jgi:hypothetical protein
MGYTHYWHRPKVLDLARFRRFREDMARLLAHLPRHSDSAGGYFADRALIVRGSDGKGDPIVTDELVSFNGDATFAGDSGDGDDVDMSHETFHLPRVYEPQDWQRPDDCGRYFDFCKTARKPYDLAVTAALITLRHHFPEVGVSSDGVAADWTAGLALCRSVLGHGQLPFESDDTDTSLQRNSGTAHDATHDLLIEAMQTFPLPLGHNLSSTASHEERSRFITTVLNWWNRYGVEADRLGLIDYRRNPRS